MAGNFAKPYPALAAGAVAPSLPNHLNACDEFPGWDNVTTVRKAEFTNGVDSSGGETLTGGHAPFARYDTADFNDENAPDECANYPTGHCGEWVKAHKFSEKLLDQTTNDIQPCNPTGATVDCVPTEVADASHFKKDLNCYTASAVHKDYKICQHVGAIHSVIRKQHHGLAGIQDRNDPLYDSELSIVPGLQSDPGTGVATVTQAFRNSPPQDKYRTIEASMEIVGTSYDLGTGAVVSTTTDNYDSTSTVDRYSGIVSTTGSYSAASATAPAEWTFLQSDWNFFFESFASFSTYFSGSPSPNAYFVDAGGGVFQHWYGTGEFNGGWPVPDFMFEQITNNGDGSFERIVNEEVLTDLALGTFLVRNLKTESCVVTNTTVEYSLHTTGYRGLPIENERVVTGTLTLSDPYTAEELYADWLDAAEQMDASSKAMLPFRSDEQLANSPLAIFDEVRAAQPALDYVATMDDYSLPQVAGDWQKMAWRDPNDYVWQWPDCSYTNAGAAAYGATLRTGLYTGEIIALNTVGSDRHFWFGFRHYVRRERPVPYAGSYLWFHDTNGELSDAFLPEATLRWMDKQAAQYDANGYFAGSDVPPGNHSQNWLRYRNAELVGGKYVVTKLPLNSVNAARPYGKDRWAMANRSVCVCDGTYLRKTGNAAEPLVGEGLQSGDTVMVGDDGVYVISAIVAAGTYADWSGENAYTYTLGAKIADLPEGVDIGAGYIGRLKWWTQKQVGTTEIASAVFDGTNTTLTIGVTPYWQALAGAAQTLSVDLYTADSTGQPLALLANVTANKALPESVAVTVAGNYSTARFMVCHDAKPWYDCNVSQGDYITREYTFNMRATDAGFTGTVPTWYGTSQGFPISGVVTGAITQRNFSFSPCCPNVLGFAPFYTHSSPFSVAPVEDFSKQEIHAFPSAFEIDDTFNAYWLGLVNTYMVCPFWEAPFKPDLDGDLLWREDSDCGGVVDGGTDSGSGLAIVYYAARDIVEARTAMRSNYGWAQNETPSLLGSTSLYYDTANVFSPDHWPNGIPIGDAITGDFASVPSDYGFYLAWCSNKDTNEFAESYRLFMPPC